MTEKAKLPKEMLIKRHKVNILTLCLKGDKKLMLFPNVNRVTDPEIIELLHNDKYNHGWKAQLENKACELLSGKEEGAPTKNTTVFTAMTAEQAIKLVRETLSIPALEQMSIDEQGKKDRKTVQDAIADQIKFIKSEDQSR